MSALHLATVPERACLGLKGPSAAAWLGVQGIEVPSAANSWCRMHSVESGAVSGARLLIARLGASEFFLESARPAAMLGVLARALEESPPGVYPVLREDIEFELGGEGVHEVLAQVCNVDFAALALGARPLILTLMIGVSVLVVPESEGGKRRYRIWCDPTFAPALEEQLETVVRESGGRVDNEPGEASG